jgi:glucose-6-phosphate isomerase
MSTFDKLQSVQALKQHYEGELSKTHLKHLLNDAARNEALRTECAEGSFIMDCTHTKIDVQGMNLLKAVADETHLFEKIDAMFKGEVINNTEKRCVLHVALRKPKTDSLIVDGNDVVKDVHTVLDQIKQFSQKVRDGTISGYTGKKLKNIVAIGIGGSFLGPEFVFEALRHDATCKAAS